MQFVDVSGFQPTIDWHAYKQWSNCAAMKATEGVGYTDPTFATHRNGALSAGIDSLLLYHFARPDLGNTPEAEANWMHQVVGAVRQNDLLVLDFEVSAPQATADWAYRFLARLEQIAGVRPAIYASTSYIQARLQDSRIARYPLWLANWTFNANVHPPCPPPWASYIALQYTDNATAIPGVPGTVDANIFLGGLAMPLPAGWKDDGTKLTCPNGHFLIKGFRQHVIDASQWDSNDMALEEEQQVPQIEVHTNSGAGARQCTRNRVLVYTPSIGVAETAAGAEIFACYQKIVSLQATITTLQATGATKTIMELENKLHQIEALAKL